MGNLHSNITQRIQKAEIFEKNWFSDLVNLFRGVRDEIMRKIVKVLQYFRLEQVPVYPRVSFSQPTRGGPLVGNLMRGERRGSVAQAQNAAYQNPDSLRMYQQQIEVTQRNEMRLVGVVCGVNLMILLFLLYYLFM